jgi:IS1 family transposase
VLDRIRIQVYQGYMNKLSHDERCKVLHMLCEGSSIRSITRVLGVGKSTVLRLLCDAGKACMAHHDQFVRRVEVSRIQVDEIWTFTYAKQRNVAGAKAAPEGAGDTWTWTAIDAESKLIVSWMVGTRDAETALDFMHDLRSRLRNRVQLTSDGLVTYLTAVEAAFGDDVDYAQLVKIYGEPRFATGPERRYSPGECCATKTRRVAGSPDPSQISTSFVERQNLTMRMHMRRFTRLTNAFSKKIENHAYAVALHMMYYNFVRIHQSLRVTPAMAAGVSDRLWEIGDIVELIEKAESRISAKRGPYKKRA